MCTGMCTQGGTGIEKKRPRVDFFLLWTLGGLTNYVIRHVSKYSSNITSSTGAFLYAPSQPHQSLVILYKCNQVLYLRDIC